MRSCSHWVINAELSIPALHISLNADKPTTTKNNHHPPSSRMSWWNCSCHKAALWRRRKRKTYVYKSRVQTTELWFKEMRWDAPHSQPMEANLTSCFIQWHFLFSKWYQSKGSTNGDIRSSNNSTFNNNTTAAIHAWSVPPKSPLHQQNWVTIKLPSPNTNMIKAKQLGGHRPDDCFSVCQDLLPEVPNKFCIGMRIDIV